MPEMSGSQFLTHVRKFLPTNVVPIIMVSAQTDERNIVANLKLGANDFVKKPYNSEELMVRINSLINVKKDWLQELLAGKDTSGCSLIIYLCAIHVPWTAWLDTGRACRLAGGLA